MAADGHSSATYLGEGDLPLQSARHMEGLKIAHRYGCRRRLNKPIRGVKQCQGQFLIKERGEMLRQSVRPGQM